MTQKDEITFYLTEFPNSTTREIGDAFSKFPYSSVRRVLSNLRKEDINIKANPLHLNRVKETVIKKVQELLEPKKPEPEELIFNRKIVKVLVYCPDQPHRAGHGKKLYALTYDNSNDDLFDELVRAIDVGEEIDSKLGIPQIDFNFTEKQGNRGSLFIFRSCLQASDFGYDGELETTDPPFIFPEIEVGEEL